MPCLQLENESWFQKTGDFLKVWVLVLVLLGMAYEWGKKGQLEDSSSFVVTGCITIFSVLSFYSEKRPPLNLDHYSRGEFDVMQFRRGQNVLNSAVLQGLVPGAWIETMAFVAACLSEHNDEFALMMARAQADGSFEARFVTGEETTKSGITRPMFRQEPGVIPELTSEQVEAAKGDTHVRSAEATPVTQTHTSNS